MGTSGWAEEMLSIACCEAPMQTNLMRSLKSAVDPHALRMSMAAMAVAPESGHLLTGGVGGARRSSQRVGMGCGGRARVEDEGRLHRHPLRELVVVLDRHQRLFVAVDAEMVHARVANHLRHRLEHPEPATHHRHNGHAVRQSLSLLLSEARRDRAGLHLQIRRRLIAQEGRHFAQQLVQVLWARRGLAHLCDLVQDERVR